MSRMCVCGSADHILHDLQNTEHLVKRINVPSFELAIVMKTSHNLQLYVVFNSNVWINKNEHPRQLPSHWYYSDGSNLLTFWQHWMYTFYTLSNFLTFRYYHFHEKRHLFIYTNIVDRVALFCPLPVELHRLSWIRSQYTGEGDLS